MDPDSLEELGRYFATRADAPLGDLELASGRTLQSFSPAGQQAASNLLVKAGLALDNGEPIVRGVRVDGPWDRRDWVTWDVEHGLGWRGGELHCVV